MKLFKKDKQSALIKKTAVPASVPAELQGMQDQATRSWWRKIWDAVHGYTANDARRLKEAAIQVAEGEAGKRIGEAKKLDAEASLKYAEAEEKRQQAALKELEVRQKDAEQQDRTTQQQVQDTERIAAAYERLADAISRIRQMGGDVAFGPADLASLPGASAQKKERDLPPAEESQPKDPGEFLTDKAVKQMLVKKDYFDAIQNPKGKGIQHQYELVEKQGEKVIIDHATGLTWQQGGSEKSMAFAEAQEYVNQLNEQQFAGFTDWRLPTLEEAMSLMEPEKNGDLYLAAIFDREQYWIWTADKHPSGPVWVANFYSGDCYNDYVYGHLTHVRAVR